MRKVAPIWWQEQTVGNLALRRQRLLGGDQAPGRQGGVSPQRRILQQPEDRAAAVPRRSRSGLAGGGQGRAAQPGRPASHPHAQDHLPRIHPARHRVAARRTPRARAQHRQGGRGGGLRRFRRAGVVRASAAGDRRPDGRAPGGPQEAVRLVESDGRRPGSGVLEERSDRRIDRTHHVRHADGGRARARIPATISSPSWCRPMSRATSSPTTNSASS